MTVGDSALGDLLLQTDDYAFDDVLDLGAGDGFAARHFAARGRRVTATGFDMASYLVEPLPAAVDVRENVDACDLACFPDAAFDAVWCSHVLEHVTDVGRALAAVRRVLRPGGRLFIVVPEYAPYVVGGHVAPGWNLGILMYVLILAGFDVRQGAMINHCWHVAAFVARGEPPERPLRHDAGDIERLADLFPPGIDARQGFDGDLLHVNWRWAAPVAAVAARRGACCRRRRLLHDLTPPLLRKALRTRRRDGID